MSLDTFLTLVQSQPTMLVIVVFLAILFALACTFPSWVFAVTNSEELEKFFKDFRWNKLFLLSAWTFAIFLTSIATYILFFFIPNPVNTSSNKTSKVQEGIHEYSIVGEVIKINRENRNLTVKDSKSGKSYQINIPSTIDISTQKNESYSFEQLREGLIVTAYSDRRFGSDEKARKLTVLLLSQPPTGVNPTNE